MRLALFGGAALQDGKQEMKMIGRLNHVAIAVPDLQAAAAQYESTLGEKLARHKMNPITV